jgi:hypothetical protein
LAYQHIKEHPMDIFVVALTIIVAVIVLDMAAIAFGTDSRDGIRDDWAR